MPIHYDPYDPFPHNTHVRRTQIQQPYGYTRSDPVPTKVALTVTRTGLRFDRSEWEGIRGSEMYLRFRRNRLSVQMRVGRERGDPYVEAAVIGKILEWAGDNATDFYYLDQDEETGDPVIYFLAEPDTVAFKLQFHGETEVPVQRDY